MNTVQEIEASIGQVDRSIVSLVGSAKKVSGRVRAKKMIGSPANLQAIVLALEELQGAVRELGGPLAELFELPEKPKDG
jgi:hypothetical protein